MMTIVTHVHLKEGAGPFWDAAMRTRLSAATKTSGWVWEVCRTSARESGPTTLTRAPITRRT